jgi:hypothetical protein
MHGGSTGFCLRQREANHPLVCSGLSFTLFSCLCGIDSFGDISSVSKIAVARKKAHFRNRARCIGRGIKISFVIGSCESQDSLSYIDCQTLTAVLCPIKAV